MSPSRSPIRLLPLLSVFQFTIAAVVDFSFYPTGAQPCLYNAASASKCDSSSVPVFNSCVCSNGGGFIDSAAKCIAANDKVDLNPVYSVMSRNCGDSNTPIAYTLDKYLQVAGAGTTTSPGTTTVQTTVQQVSTITSQGTTLRITTSAVQTTVVSQAAPSAVVSTLTLGGQAPGESASVTVVTLVPVGSATGSSSPSSTTSATPAPANKGLSTGAIIGISAGVGGPLVLALIGLIAVLVWRGKRKGKSAPVQNYPNTEPSTTGMSPRPMSTVTTLDNYNRYSSQPGVGVAGMPKHDYSPPAQYVQQNAPNAYPTMYNVNRQQVYEAQNTQVPQSQAYPANAYPPPQPGTVEMGGTPAVRPQELPGHTGYHY